MATMKVSNGFSDPAPERDAYGQTAAEFMEHEFEFEFCSECGKDQEDHTAVIDPFGHWFAYCNSGAK